MKTCTQTAKITPTFGPVFAQFRQEMVQAVRVLLFLLGSQGR
ncbi:MAG: hypothetical protein V8T29_03600 [Oscillospiraceae bacterium]